MFHEIWYSEPQKALLAERARSVLNLNGKIIEIGCWEGNSTIALANAIYPQVLDVVDTWQGNYDESPDNVSVLLAKERDIYSEFLINITENTKNNILVNKMDCFVYLANLKESVKFCHIDACHDYASVKQTIRMLIPKLVPGGILCGDDVATAHKFRDDLQGGVEKAVEEMCHGHEVIENFWSWKKP